MPYGAHGLPYGVPAPHKAEGGRLGYYDGGDTTASGTALRSGNGSTGNTTVASPSAASEGHSPSYVANQAAAARYNASNNSNSGSSSSTVRTPTPVTVQQTSNSSTTPEKNNFLNNLLTGHLAGYKNYWDMVNGGGQYGSYAQPGENMRGLGAIVNDIKTGGLGKLAWDAINGGGLGGAGEKFSNSNKFGVSQNLLGINPAGQDKSPYNWLQGPLGVNRPPPRPADMPYTARATGGATDGVPIVAAGGEYVIPPEDVVHIGGGDLDNGHKILDSFVKKMRQKTIKTLQNLPGPKKD